MSEGWIKLHRKMREWQHYQNPSARMVFEDLLFDANSSAMFWHGHEVKRGETMISISSLECNTGLSRKTIIKVLKLLEKTGEIKRVKYAGAIKTIVCNFDNYQGDSGIIPPPSTPVVPPPIPPPVPPPSTPEQEYKELKNNISANADNNPPIIPPGLEPSKKKKKEPEKYSFVVAPEFEESFSTWLEYKHQRRQSYKTPKSLEACYKKLLKLANNDPATAMAIVEQSLANNWAGLFPLKQDYATTTINQSTDPRQRERETLARDYAATIARRLAEDDARAGKVRKP